MATQPNQPNQPKDEPGRKEQSPQPDKKNDPGTPNR
jgi:hypothetical protein